MSTEVDICNLALSRLGDDATVASIDPPEGSAQAAHCATFYPIARDSLLELHAWGFATRRAALALLSATPPSEWQYVYAAPSSMLNILAVTASDAGDDYSMGLPVPFVPVGQPDSLAAVGVYTPQPYVLESDEDGAQVIYTNQVNAVIRFTALITDPTLFTPLFTNTLSMLLAAYLAGPVLKGQTGITVGDALEKKAMAMLPMAKTSDSNQRRATTAHVTPWQAGR